MNDKELLTVALPKGRLFEPAVRLLEAAGVSGSGRLQEGRELVMVDVTNSMRYLLVRPADVIAYVEHGAADLGVTGKDSLLETDGQVVELLDLGIGYCRIVVAGPVDRVLTPAGKPLSLDDYYQTTGQVVQVATKFPQVAREYFRTRKVPVQIIRLKGSVELGPLVGLSDLILDLVATGKTLTANDLVEMETVAEITARLIANPVSYRVNNRRVRDLVAALRRRL